MFKQTANDVWPLNFDRLGEEFQLKMAAQTIDALHFNVRVKMRKDLWMIVEAQTYTLVRNTIISNIP